MLGTSVIPDERKLMRLPRTAGAATTPARPAARACSALLLSLALIEAAQFGLCFTVAWFGGLGPATVQMGWKAAAQAALHSRGVTRLIRLALQLTALPFSLRWLRDASEEECTSVVRERLQQLAAVLVTLLLTARTLDVWLAVDAAGRPTYARAATAPGTKLCNLMRRLPLPIGDALAQLGEFVITFASAAGATLTKSYTCSLGASSPIGVLVRADRQCGLLASATATKLQLWWAIFWARALPVLLRAKALLIREEGVWF